MDVNQRDERVKDKELSTVKPKPGRSVIIRFLVKSLVLVKKEGPKD